MADPWYDDFPNHFVGDLVYTGRGWDMNSSVGVMGERDVAQAVVLIQALSEVRDELIARMTWLERRGCRLDAAALRRDVNEAQDLANRLQRDCLGGDVQASQPVRFGAAKHG